MLNIEEAQELILRHINPLDSEQLHVTKSLRRVVSCDIYAPEDIPNAAVSSMDGYCFASAAQRDRHLTVIDFLPAGKERTTPVMNGDAVRIMTGAPIPVGCDTVIPFEDVVTTCRGITLNSELPIGANIRIKGADVKSSERVIEAGTLISPQAIGLLVSIGKTEVPVNRKPRVAIIATGDEVAPLGSILSPGQVVNSNSYAIAAQVEEAGGIPLILGIAHDSMEELCEMLLLGVAADLIITTGGASVGDRDYVKNAICSLDGEIKFWKVKMKPGKPVAFGLVRNVPILVLPGNPVSAMVGFEMFARLAILKMTGIKDLNRTEIIAVTTELLSNPGDRTLIVFVNIEFNSTGVSVSKPERQSSTCYLAMTQSNGFCRLRPGALFLPGDKIQAYFTDSLFC